MNDNTFHAPKTDTVLSEPLRLMCWSTVRFILLVGALGCMMGASAGTLVGWLAPEYYQQMFNNHRNPDFEPLSFGMAIGCMQGLRGGVALGLGRAVIQAWLDDRRATMIYQANHR